MYPEPIKVGVIGLGIGRWHIENYLAMPDVKVLAICDIDEQKLKSMTIKYGIPKIYKHYEDLCQNEEIDAVSVCVPNNMHAPVIISALENNKHVLCEKPISHSLSDAEKILQTSRKFPDLKAMMTMKFRFNKDVVYTKGILEKGELGDIYYGFASYIKLLNDNIENSWRKDKNLSGGGTLMDNGLHIIDLIWWLMGCPKFSKVSGAIYDEHGRANKSDIEYLATGIIKFENGASMFFESAWAKHTDKENMEARIFGTKGSISLWPSRICYLVDNKIVSKSINTSDFNSQNQFKHFISCIMNNKQPIPNLEQGVELLRIINALYRSTETENEHNPIIYDLETN